MKPPYPHCSELVLHAPQKCDICSQYPELQQERIRTGTNFTGENNPSKYPCPAQLQRSEQDINKWAGNRPETPKVIFMHGGTTDAQ